MAKTLTPGTREFVRRCTAMASDVLRLPARHISVDYDEEADVLYMSFRRPQRATETIEAGDDILIRKDGQRIVGLTILNASTR